MANQMFIYACATSLAKQQQKVYCLSSLGNLKYFKLSPSDYLFNRLKYTQFRLANLLTRKYTQHHLQDNLKDYSDLLLQQTNNLWYYGYFQSEKYLFGNSDIINKRFEIKNKYIVPFQKYFPEIKANKKLVAVHVRRSDYKDFNLKEINGPNLCLPNSYYWECLLPYIDKEDYRIIFVSDEIIEVKNDFKDIPNALFSENTAIVDFQILMNADVLVLANSSFSWWGAWLNKKENKEVMVPKYFLGFKVKKEYPINIIPSNWKQIEVNE